MTRPREPKPTSAEAVTDAVAKTAPPVRRDRPSGKKNTSSCLKGSLEAKQKASLILEALSGLRSTGDASAAIGVTVARYYQLESRALQGLVDALEARPPGGQPSPETEAKRLQRERDRLERELRRAQALVRVAQRAVGLPPPQPARDTTGDGKKRQKRRVEVRTTRALARFRAPEAAAANVTAAPATTAAPTT